MKLIFKGKFKSYDDLPKGNLPENAVMFKEPKSMVMVNVVALLICIPIALIMSVLLFLTDKSECMKNVYFLGLLIAFLLTVPHEFIHSVCMGGKDTVVNLYYSLKHFMMFVQCTEPMSKTRFIVMSFAPSFILGWVPFIVGLFLPKSTFTGVLLSAGLWGALLGCGDMINIINATFQMPKGSLTQMSGMNSYWFMPEDKAEGDT